MSWGQETNQLLIAAIGPTIKLSDNYIWVLSFPTKYLFRNQYVANCPANEGISRNAVALKPLNIPLIPSFFNISRKHSFDDLNLDYLSVCILHLISSIGVATKASTTPTNAPFSNPSIKLRFYFPRIVLYIQYELKMMALTRGTVIKGQQIPLYKLLNPSLLIIALKVGHILAPGFTCILTFNVSKKQPEKQLATPDILPQAKSCEKFNINLQKIQPFIKLVKFEQYQMNYQNQQKHIKALDPRFYYIKVNTIDIISQQLRHSKKVLLKFTMGNKYSQTGYKISGEKILKHSKFEDEAFIFKYSGEQILNLNLSAEEHNKSNNTQSQKQKEASPRKSGYCRIVLAPLIQKPHIKHIINAQLIVTVQNVEEKDALIAKIQLQIYFLLNFHAQLEIIPLSANLENNVAAIGEMRPKVCFKIQDQQWKSEEVEGGIHPRWSGHFFAKPNLNGYISKSRQSQHLKKLDLQSYLIYNTLPPDSCFQYHKFDLKSAGSSIKIQVQSLPIIGKQPDIVGQTQIRIQNNGFYRHPRQLKEQIFQTKDIKLYQKTEDNLIPVGSIKIYFRFIFDKNQIIHSQTQQYDLQEIMNKSN